jgi:magnesium transporter
LITIYKHDNGQLSAYQVPGAVPEPLDGEEQPIVPPAAVAAPPIDATNAVWLDLVHPTKTEEREIERLVGIQVPTREEMAEIEVSSRLYFERGAHYMTANILYAVDSPEPQGTAITFILTDKYLITVRYAEPRAMRLFLTRANQGDTSCDSPTSIMIGLMEAIIDREADLIERLQL